MISKYTSQAGLRCPALLLPCMRRTGLCLVRKMIFLFLQMSYNHFYIRCSQQPLQCGDEILIASWTDSRVPPSAVSILSRVSCGWKLARVFFSSAALATAFPSFRSLPNPMRVKSASSLCSPDHVGLLLRSREARSTQRSEVGKKARTEMRSSQLDKRFVSFVRASG